MILGRGILVFLPRDSAAEGHGCAQGAPIAAGAGCFTDDSSRSSQSSQVFAASAAAHEPVHSSPSQNSVFLASATPRFSVNAQTF